MSQVDLGVLAFHDSAVTALGCSTLQFAEFDIRQCSARLIPVIEPRDRAQNQPEDRGNTDDTTQSRSSIR
eukprot:scaffold553373_cov43-Prasinocladus_malaysianus.AAC.1